MEQSKLARINELAQKARTEGLTEAEVAEQKVLRAEYLAAYRANLRAQLDNLTVTDAHGNVQPLKKKSK